MPRFDFPDSPMEGQKYEANGVGYVYTGKVWNSQPFDMTPLEIALDRKVDVAGDNMIGHLGLPTQDPARNHAITRSWVENYYPQEAPPDGTVYARQAAVQVPGSAIIPLASDGKWVAIDPFIDAPHTSEAYGRKDGYWIVVPEEAPREPDNIYGRCDGLWALTVSKKYVDDKNLEQDIMLDRKVNAGGDTMLDSLYLPPGNPTQGYEAVHKNYCDTKVEEAPTDGLAYVRISAGWEPVPKELADIPIMLDRKVNRGGDTMLDSLYLPPGNPVQGYEATHKNYVDTKVEEAPEDGKPYSRQDKAWVLAFDPLDMQIQLDRKVNRGGDTMLDSLYLPPANPTQGYEATHKNYVDSMSGRVVTSPEPPTGYNVQDGTLWWDEDSAGLYLYYDDGTSRQWLQVNGGAAGGMSALADSLPPADDVAYGVQSRQWTPVYNINYGDVKEGFQHYDHNGWYMLDGRAVSALPNLPQSRAIALGFTTNLPNATGVVSIQTAGTLGEITGSMTRTITIAQGNLPNVTLSAGSAGAHTHTAGSAGAHTHTTDSQPPFSMGTGPSRGRAGVGGSGYYYTDAEGSYHQSIAHTHVVASAGAHTHATDSQGAHTHNVSLGGAGTAITLDIKPMAMAVNKFVYLGSSFSR